MASHCWGKASPLDFLLRRSFANLGQFIQIVSSFCIAEQNGFCPAMDKHSHVVYRGAALFSLGSSLLLIWPTARDNNSIYKKIIKYSTRACDRLSRTKELILYCGSPTVILIGWQLRRVSSLIARDKWVQNYSPTNSCNPHRWARLFLLNMSSYIYNKNNLA